MISERGRFREVRRRRYNPLMATFALLTAEEYLRLPENGCPTELVRGRIVPMNVPNFRHGKICARLASLLTHYAEEHQLGHVLCNDAGVVTQRDPDTVRGPDVSFYSYARIPKGAEPGGYPGVVPEIAIEVRSPTDRWAKILGKVSEYLTAGVDLVYVIGGQSQSIFAYTADEPSTSLGIDDEVAFPAPFDGLRLPVRRVFES